MTPDNPSELRVEGWLKTLGVDSLCQWDVLVFLHRHRSCLVSGEHIARLLGYSTSAVVAALDRLESLGLVARSRVGQGVRFYQLTAPADSPPDHPLNRLFTIAASRAGRLLLTRQLPGGASANSRAGPFPSHAHGSASWLTAI